MITVSKIDETTFDVKVESQSTTTHRVTLPKSYYENLTKSKTSPERLIEKSFEFLLQREPNTSILSSFELSVIGRYFAEYESEIRKML